MGPAGVASYTLGAEGVGAKTTESNDGISASMTGLTGARPGRSVGCGAV